VNKSFIVERGLSPRQMLIASKRLSNYMHFVMSNKSENIWIAQREGRAKDSNDRTQEALLKMLTIGGEGSLADKLKEMHIVPLAISYEYDPCDYLKAAEMQAKRDDANWKKGPMDDVVSMQTGIMGYKGAIHYQAAPCIDEYLETLKAATDMSNGQLLDAICLHIDKEIHRNYRLYPNNYVAADLLEGGKRFANHYTAKDVARFEKYLQSRLDLIELPNKDEAYLRERMLTMYANPLYNYLKAHEG